MTNDQLIDEINTLQEVYLARQATLEIELGRLGEEVDECRKAFAQDDLAHLDQELGDVLLAVHKLCRLRGKEPAVLLDASLWKVHDRLEHIARRVTAGATREEALAEAKKLYP